MVSQKQIQKMNSIKSKVNTNVTAENLTLSRNKIATQERNEFMPIKVLGGKMYNGEDLN